MMTIIALFAWIVAHQTLILSIVSCIVVFDHWLAGTESLKSNSTAQFILNAINGALKVFGLVYKLATGKALVVPVENANAEAAPRPDTAGQAMQKAIDSPATVLAEGEAAVMKQAIDAGSESLNALKGE